MHDHVLAKWLRHIQQLAVECQIADRGHRGPLSAHRTHLNATRTPLGFLVEFLMTFAACGNFLSDPL